MRYCPVVLSANGRVKPDAVLVNGKPERHPEGAYYIEWRDERQAQYACRWARTQPTPLPAPAQREPNSTLNGDATVPEIAANGHRSVAAIGGRVPRRNGTHEEAEDAGGLHDSA